MNGFPIQNLALSLAFPWLNLVVSAVYLLLQQFFLESAQDGLAVHITALVTIVLGGLLPIILTLALKIDTSSYFKRRLIPTVLIVFCDDLLYNRASTTMFFICVSAEFLCNVLYRILKIEDELTSARERAVLILSDPVFYFTAFVVFRAYYRWAAFYP